jgi:hypothetical protein
MLWKTILLPSRPDQSSVLTGLTLGVSSGMKRDIACYRVAWDYLGEPGDLRARLAGCGLFDLGSPIIPRDIPRCCYSSASRHLVQIPPRSLI